jgi:hypothetical protein
MENISDIKQKSFIELGLLSEFTVATGSGAGWTDWADVYQLGILTTMHIVQ